MNRKNNVPFSPSPVPRKAAPVYKQPPPRSVPQGFREAMLHVSVKSAPNNSNTRTTDTAAKTTQAQKRPAPPAAKWKSSFKPVDEEDDDDDNAKKKSTNSPERVELYDPYNPASSDTEDEMPQAQDDSQSLPNPDNNLERQRLSLPDLDDNLERQRLSLPDQDNNLEHQRLLLPDLDNNLERQRLSPPNQDNNLERKRLSPRRGHWDVEAGSRLLDRHDLNPEHRPAEGRGLSPGYRLPERRAYSPDVEPLDPSGYASISRPLDHRVCSPDRLIHGSSTQRFPSSSYGAQRTNSEERIVIPEYRREVSPMATTVRLSPPRLQRDYQYQSGYVEKGLDKITPSTDVTRNRSKILIMDKNPITCDLCDAVLANGQELLDHLESKTHWDTLEHIQQENNYDDLAIAFLQEFLLYKSRQCSRAIEDSVLPALQENDHMTRIEIFHCAACNVFLSTSASSVQTHITSQEHLSSTKEFEVQQRHACLGKAETMMKELKPQFEHFLKHHKSRRQTSLQLISLKSGSSHQNNLDRVAAPLTDGNH